MRSAEPKIKTALSFTPRQVNGLDARAKRLGISFADMVRRIVDAWIDKDEADVAALQPKVLVLDRKTNELRSAR